MPDDNRISEKTTAEATTSRRLALGTGLLGLAGVAAAGCSTYGGSDDGNEQQSGGDQGGGQQSGGGTVLGKAADVPVGGGKIFADKKIVVTQPAKGEFKAFSAVCTHQGCTVDEIKDGTIDCPCHGSKFKIADASVADGPASKPLPPAQITVSGTGEIRLS
jgi:Rieske Fe-S protein